VSLKKLWFRISHNGITHVTDLIELQSLLVTNRICIIAISLLIIIGTALGFRQWNTEPILVVSFSTVFAIILFLVSRHHFNTARLLLCFLPPPLILGMSVISKIIPGEVVTDSEYFDYRYVLIAASIVPSLVFGFTRKGLLSLSILPYLLAFLLFDTIHNFLQVGYFQIQHTDSSYGFSQWIATIMFCVITMGVLMLRHTSDEVHLRNSLLIQRLNDANILLGNQRNEIELANQKIQQQNVVLSQSNNLLASKVELANKELQAANDELVKHNIELQQFSHTISHNLRSPVASILGLINLIDPQSSLSKDPLIEHLKKSAKVLDATIRDLGRIIDIRNDIFKVRLHVNINEVLDEILTPFEKEIAERGILIECDIKAAAFYSIKPMIVSILHNLLSNALKYSSKNRIPVIKIVTADTDREFQLSVWDNGIGIDLEAYGNELFKLYKRFNNHTEGRGIGLYLMKQQVTGLGGTIGISSKVDSYTEFSISLPKPINIEHQILVGEECAEVFFDAKRNLTCITWHREVSGDEYRNVLNRSLSFMMEYTVAHWLMDIRKRSNLSPEDHLWLVETLLPTAFKQGLKRLSVVYSQELSPATIDFYKRNEAVFQKYDIEVFFTKSINEAYNWLEDRRWYYKTSGTDRTDINHK